MNLRVLYRGPLSSCNYACDYCPFAKRVETAEELAKDRAALIQFTDWCVNQPHRLGILFTPWGEALVRKWYVEALIRLSHADSISRVAIQTNLSAKLDWVNDCDLSKLALWATFHPGEVEMHRFLAKCQTLHSLGVRFSVGVVGLKEHLDCIEQLRCLLPKDVYLWVNAFKRETNYYLAEESEFLRRIDTLFEWNNQNHPSMGESCRTGESVFSVDGEGAMRRCHFVKEVIGNIYEPNWEQSLRPRVCPNATCGCHIGYVHMDRLNQDAIYGDRILERIPLELAVTVPEEGRRLLQSRTS